MKIFLATASLADVRWADEHGLIDGIVTTPAMLAAESPEEERELLAELCRSVDAPVHASVRAINPADIYRDGRELAKVADNVVVQIPLIEDALVPLRRLTSDGVRVTATLVFTAAQAFLAAKAGASSVAAALDQLDAHGHPSQLLLREIRALLDAAGLECDLLALAPQNAVQFAECVIARADGVGVSPAVLRSLLLHPLTDRGVDQFLGELAKRPKPRPAS